MAVAGLGFQGVLNPLVQRRAIWEPNISYIKHSKHARCDSNLSLTAQVNMWNGFDAGVPFGGYKTSGIGREKGEAALSHYTQVSIMLITEVVQLQKFYDHALHVQT